MKRAELPRVSNDSISGARRRLGKIPRHREVFNACNHDPLRRRDAEVTTCSMSSGY